MFENIKNIFKKAKKKELLKSSSKDTAKERLHLVLMQDRANVSADFLDLMRREIIEVIKKYIDIDEDAMDVRLTTETNEDGVQGVPALYANIPIINIKEETRKLSKTNQENKLNMEDTKSKISKKEETQEKENSKQVKSQEKESNKPKEEKEAVKNQTPTTQDEEEKIERRKEKSKETSTNNENKQKEGEEE